MKNILLAIIFLLIPLTASAEVFVIYNSSTKDVVSISKRDDAVVPSGCEKHILTGNIEDYQLENDAKYYRFVNKRFVLNSKKISDEEKAKEDAVQKDLERVELKRTAVSKLVGLGLTNDEVKALFE